MPSDVCTLRLRKELREIQRNPVENIRAAPRETNILEWHYVIEGAKKSNYEGGFYHGVVTFPPEYPYKPPSIQMLTPNGRFKVSQRLCLSMSDFHPETWNPMWSVGTILMGLYSFMQEETPTHGSIVTSAAFKKKCAIESLEFNCRNKHFRDLFTELVELHEKRKQELSSGTSAAGGTVSELQTNTSQLGREPNEPVSWTAILGVFAAVVACTWAVLALIL